MPKNLIESSENIRAYEIWKELGFRRSYRETAKRVEKSVQTISTWAKRYGWIKRLEEYGAGVEKMKAVGELVESDDPIIKQVSSTLQQARAAIDSVFITQKDGTIKTTVEITSADDLSKVLREYRQLIETYYKMVSRHDAADTTKLGASKAGKITVKNLNVKFGDIPQEKRINILEGLLSENGLDGDSQPEGGVQEGDFTEVSERGDEDGPGCEGVPGSVANCNSGDKTHM